MFADAERVIQTLYQCIIVCIRLSYTVLNINTFFC